MMYEGGWGKKLSYIISSSCFETVDVTRRYTRKWQEVLQRRLEVPEAWLSLTLAQLNAQLQFQMMLPDALYREHEARRAAEQQQLLLSHTQASSCETSLIRPIDIEAQDAAAPLPPRQSGSLEWRQSRGEMGDS
jgi:peptide-N4-(N-acetyl-beta-glucosaminyl)asparagine amidase